MDVDKRSVFLNFTFEGDIKTSITPSIEELKNIISNMKKEKKIFLSFDWIELHPKPKALRTVTIAWTEKEKNKLFERNVLTIEESDIEHTLSKIKEILENRNIIKVIFSPRSDFTSFLHYGIKVQKIFDIQACVQCLKARKDSQSPHVMSERISLENICAMYDISIKDMFSADISKVICQMDLDECLTKKKGEWFTASNRIKYLFRRRMVRMVHLTTKQEDTLRRNCHRFSSRFDNMSTTSHPEYCLYAKYENTLKRCNKRKSN